MKLPPPLRFLLLVLLCWTGGRAAFHALPPELVEAPVSIGAPAPIAIVERQPPMALAQPSAAALLAPSKPRIFAVRISGPPPVSEPPPLLFASAGMPAPLPMAPPSAPIQIAPPLPPFMPPPPPASATRWSGSAWLFVRGGDAAALAPGGTISGSQAGARLLYRLGRDARRPLAASARLYAPLKEADAAELALGLDWKPASALPFHLLVERRQALGGTGRPAFAASVYGGLGEQPIGPLRLDAYGQAGIVGTRSRALFADASVRLGLPVGRARLGLGAWGAAQPDAERLDIGPQASLTFKGTPLVIAVDWRLRIAGDAAPRSGPALTVSTGF